MFDLDIIQKIKINTNSTEIESIKGNMYKLPEKHDNEYYLYDLQNDKFSKHNKELPGTPI